MPTSPTLAQADISRRNGARSRGPATEQGKARSSQNNTRHNLHGAFRLLPGEDEAAHAALTADLRARYAPAGETERRWVDEIAFALWRRRRLQAVEAAALATAEDGGADEPEQRPLPSLATLARYRARVERDHRFAEEQLAALRAARPRLPRDLVGAQADQLRWLAARMEERAGQDRGTRGTDEPDTPAAAAAASETTPAPAEALDPALSTAFDRSMGTGTGPTTPNRRERRRLAALARGGLRLVA